MPHDDGSASVRALGTLPHLALALGETFPRLSIFPLLLLLGLPCVEVSNALSLRLLLAAHR
jgi:hypothetical protein